MTMLVTLQQARDHIRSDTNADDADLTMKIEAASDAVIGYLDGYIPVDTNGDPAVDSHGDIVGVPARAMTRIKQATLLTIGYFYKERDGSQEFAVPKEFGYGYPLPQGATALLFPLAKIGPA